MSIIPDCETALAQAVTEGIVRTWFFLGAGIAIGITFYLVRRYRHRVRM